MLRLIVLFTALLPTLAVAQKTPPVDYVVFNNPNSTTTQNLLENADLNTNPSVVLTLDRKWRAAAVSVFYVRGAGAAASDVKTTFECYQDSKSPAFLQSRKIADGTSTLSDFTDIKAVTATKSYMIPYGVAPCNYVRLVFSGTGSNANDDISVQVTAYND